VSVDRGAVPTEEPLDMSPVHSRASETGLCQCRCRPSREWIAHAGIASGAQSSSDCHRSSASCLTDTTARPSSTLTSATAGHELSQGIENAHVVAVQVHDGNRISL
jgi:hypothetical protein